MPLLIILSPLIVLTSDPDDMAITRAIIALGESLQMQVIAEGVETEEQARFLIDEGCFLAQGFLYAKPMGSEDLNRYLVLAHAKA